jgi:hypothetical protein
VLLTYVDESYTKQRYFIAALLVPETEASSLTSSLDKIVEETSYTYGRISQQAELHGYDLVSDKNDWLRLLNRSEFVSAYTIELSKQSPITIFT